MMEGWLWGILWQYMETEQPPAADPRYPVFLSDIESQRQLGLLEANYGPYRGEPELPNKCFYYGDGGNLISVSDDFLDAYVSRGFSKETMCMGLLSGIRFNPETGQRLATVVMVDLKEVQSPDYFGEPGPITEEIPVELPGCFHRGLPLVDCRFAHHPITGAPMKPADTDRIAEAGAKALAAGRKLIAEGKYSRPCAAGDAARPLEDESCYTTGSEGVRGYLPWEYRVNALHPQMVPLGGFYRFDPAFSEGFAYAIMADGAAGPSASMDSVNLVLSGKNRATSASLNALIVAARDR
ncbi:hypothetical protein CVT23_22645 [Minwuia thermotolerans]|uniref:Uncharacterized protein n=2 Tax=Minwuia thermotolerans TaxID=2056226 RepID=A0A2M9FV71_9PROT|nr:hypothetical protein CVT23_22645 [Minwuia thermotolerans]